MKGFFLLLSLWLKFVLKENVLLTEIMGSTDLWESSTSVWIRNPSKKISYDFVSRGGHPSCWRVSGPVTPCCVLVSYDFKPTCSWVKWSCSDLLIYDLREIVLIYGWIWDDLWTWHWQNGCATDCLLIQTYGEETVTIKF